MYRRLAGLGVRMTLLGNWFAKLKLGMTFTLKASLDLEFPSRVKNSLEASKHVERRAGVSRERPERASWLHPSASPIGTLWSRTR